MIDRSIFPASISCNRIIIIVVMNTVGKRGWAYKKNIYQGLGMFRELPLESDLLHMEDLSEVGVSDESGQASLAKAERVSAMSGIAKEGSALASTSSTSS